MFEELAVEYQPALCIATQTERGTERRDWGNHTPIWPLLNAIGRSVHNGLIEKVCLTSALSSLVCPSPLLLQRDAFLAEFSKHARLRTGCRQNDPKTT